MEVLSVYMAQEAIESQFGCHELDIWQNLFREADDLPTCASLGDYPE